MDSRLNLAVAMERSADQRRFAEAHGRGTHRSGRPRAESTIALRLARAQDAATVARLAALDSASTPLGEVLLAEVDGEPVAALSLADGQLVASPMVPTMEAAALLRLRARHLDDARRGPRRRMGLRTRAA